MKEGGRRKLVIYPEAGYGKAGSPPEIPPNSKLVFDVELLKVNCFVCWKGRMWQETGNKRCTVTLYLALGFLEMLAVISSIEVAQQGQSSRQKSALMASTTVFVSMASRPKSLAK